MLTLDQIDVPEIEAGASFTGSADVELPAEAPAELRDRDTVYVRLVSDSGSAVDESNESNNEMLGLGVDTIELDVTSDEYFTVLTHGFNPNPFSYQAMHDAWSDTPGDDDYDYVDAVKAFATDLGFENASEFYSELWRSTEGWYDAILSTVAFVTARTMAILQPQNAFLWRLFGNYAYSRIEPAMDVAERYALQAGASIAERVISEYSSRDDGPLVHLIGHSRGGAVSAFASYLLDSRGYPPAQLTVLDGYSTDWPDLSSILADVDINLHARADRKVNFRVQDGLAQYVAELAGSLVPDFLGGPALDNYLQSNDFLDQFLDWKAPERSPVFVDDLIVGYLGTDSNHLNVNDLYFFSHDYERQGVAPRSYLLDSPIGRGAAAAPTSRAEGEPGPSFEAQLAAASHFLDGSFEMLPLANRIPSEVTPELLSENPYLQAYANLTQLPGRDLSLAWQTEGSTQLVTEDDNSLAQLSAGGGLSDSASLSQILAVPTQPTRMNFDFAVLSASPDSQFQVNINGEPAYSIDLVAAASTNLDVDLSEWSDQIVTVSLELVSDAETTTSVTIDNVTVDQPLQLLSLSSDPALLQGEDRLTLTAQSDPECTVCPEAVEFYLEMDGELGLQRDSDRLIGTADSAVSGSWTIDLPASEFASGVETVYALATTSDTTGPFLDYQLLVIQDDEPLASPVVTVSPAGPGGDPAALPGTSGQPTSWANQRSSLRQISVDLPIMPAAVSASDLVLTNLGVDARAGGDADQVIDTLRDDQLMLSGYNLTINLDANQLSDGVYQLELKSALTGGVAFTLVGSRDNGLFVLRGDWNGSGAVTVLDFASFSYWFGRSVNTNTDVPADQRLAPEYVDLNDSGAVTVLDFAGFSSNFNKQLRFPGDPAGVTAAASAAEGESLLTAPPHRADVDGDGAVTSRDAVDVIDALVALADRKVISLQTDVNGDGRLTAADALTVINRLAEDLGDQDADENDELASIDQLLSDPAFLGGLF